MRIKVLDKALYEEELGRGFVPKKAGDAGIDLRCTEDTEIAFKQTAIIPLGVAVQLPLGTVGWLTGRSSTVTAFGILTHEGKIDAGYRGEIHGIITALERGCFIARGERICQLVVLPIFAPDGVKLEDRLAEVAHDEERGIARNNGWTVVEELDASERGKHGLGSTGRN